MTNFSFIKNKKKLAYLLLISISLLFILPFFLVTQFTYLTADDFCLANSNFPEYLNKIVNWYLGQNGRYAHALIARLPIYDLKTYRIVLSIVFVFFSYSIYRFTRGLFFYFNLELNKLKLISLWLLFQIATIALIPSPFEFFYWYSSASSYLVGISLFLLMGNILMEYERGERISALIASSIVFILVGSNELFIPITNLLLGLILLKAIWNKGKIFPLIYLNIAAFTGSLMVIFAPGTFSRRQYFEEGGNLIFSLNSSIETSFKFILFQVVNFPFVFLYAGLFLGILILSHSGKRKYGISYLAPFRLMAISFILFVSVVFVPYYAQGYLEIYKERIGNIIHIIFFLLFLFNIFNLCVYLYSKYKIKKWSIEKYSVIFFFLFLVFLPLRNKNYRLMAGDLKNNRFQTYNHLVKSRIKTVEKFKGDELILDKIESTQILKHYELGADPSFWVNECYLIYIRSKLSNNVNSVRVK